MNNLKISSSSTKMAEKRSWKAQLKSEDGENFAFSATLALFPKIAGFGNDEVGEFKIYSHHNTGITQFIFYQKEKNEKISIFQILLSRFRTGILFNYIQYDSSLRLFVSQYDGKRLFGTWQMSGRRGNFEFFPGNFFKKYIKIFSSILIWI